MNEHSGALIVVGAMLVGLAGWQEKGFAKILQVIDGLALIAIPIVGWVFFGILD